MNFNLIKKLLFNTEFRLYELLKTKKKLESRFLNNNFKVNSFKLRFRYFLITRKIYFLF